METKDIFEAIQKAAETIATPNIAAWLSVVLSFLAIVVASIVAWKQGMIMKTQNDIAQKQAAISEQQNKIALFEKRYDVYYEVVKIIGIGEELDSSEPMTISAILDALEAALGIKVSNRKDTSAISTTIVARILEAEHILDQSMFLFPHVSETDIDNLLNSAAEFIGFVEMSDKEKLDMENAYVKNFSETSKEFKEKYLKMITEKLDLTGSV